MPEALPNQLYVSSINGRPNVISAPSYNTPYGYSTINYNQLGDYAKQYLDFYKRGAEDYRDRNPLSYQNYINEYNKLGGDDIYGRLTNNTATAADYAKVFNIDAGILTPMSLGQTSASRYTVDPTTGNMTTLQAIQEQEANKAAVQAGTMQNIGTQTAPLYVPTGSSGATLNQAIQSGQVSATNPQQQLQAIGQPAPTPQPQTAVGGVLQPQAPQQPAQPQGQVQAQAIQTPGPTIPNTQPQQQQQIAGLTAQQIQGLDAAAARVAQGTANATDLKNLEYAKAKFGYNYQSPTQNAPQGNIGASSGATGGTTQGTVTDPYLQQIQGILEKYGVKPLDPTKSPMTNFVDAYKQVYTDLGLTTVKSEIEKVTKQYNDLQNELNDKVVEINNDPWLTEGVRVARVNKLKEKYEGRLGNLNDQIKIYDSLYQQGRLEAQFVANAGLEQAQQQQKMTQDLVLKAIDYAESQAKVADTKHSTIYTEWQDYVSTGGKLSFDQYMTMDANRKRSISNTNVTYDQRQQDNQIQNFYNDAGTWIAKLGAEETSWGTAWNAMRAKYPEASNELIDNTLMKNTYYEVVAK